VALGRLRAQLAMTSQYSQDLFVLDLLGGLRGGFFLDAGASDGVTVSNTLLLENAFGWSGICVEPNDAFFAELVKNRNCYCVHCCLYDRDGDVEFVEGAGTLGGILDEYHPDHLEYATRSYALREHEPGRPATVSKQARTLRSVLREARAPAVLDYWSLDTEGSELAILRSFPFDEFTFRVLTVEHNWLPMREEIHAFLEPRGYRRIAELVIDDCYVHESLMPQPAWRSAVWGASRRR
jgi:FkbM family methyltransferase